jgi:hypothetical protein
MTPTIRTMLGLTCAVLLAVGSGGVIGLLAHHMRPSATGTLSILNGGVGPVVALGSPIVMTGDVADAVHWGVGSNPPTWVDTLRDGELSAPVPNLCGPGVTGEIDGRPATMVPLPIGDDCTCRDHDEHGPHHVHMFRVAP